MLFFGLVFSVGPLLEIFLPTPLDSYSDKIVLIKIKSVRKKPKKCFSNCK